ncbi:MAG TPA: hypothetical protein DEB25_04730 [Desulfobulbaceae bacterium]|nr:hypothetical protein [Desulfobulbaceae bacterium]
MRLSCYSNQSGQGQRHKDTHRQANLKKFVRFRIRENLFWPGEHGERIVKSHAFDDERLAQSFVIAVKGRYPPRRPGQGQRHPQRQSGQGQPDCRLPRPFFPLLMAVLCRLHDFSLDYDTTK